MSDLSFTEKLKNQKTKVIRYLEQFFFGECTEPGTLTGTNESHDDLFQFESISEHLPYECFDPETQLYDLKGAKGFCLEAEPMIGAPHEKVELLQSLVQNVLPVGAQCQILMHASNKIGEFFDDYVKQREAANAHPVALRNAKTRAAFFKKACNESALKSESYLLRDFRLFFSVVFDDLDERSEQVILNCKAAFMGGLESAGIQVKMLSPTQLIRLVDDLLRPNHSVYGCNKEWHPLEPLNTQMCDPSYQRLVERTQLSQVGSDLKTLTFRVNHYAKRPTQLFEMTDAIGNIFQRDKRLGAPFSLSFAFRIDDQQKQARTMKLRADSAEKRAIAVGKNSQKAIEEAQTWRGVVGEQERGTRLVSSIFQVNLYCKSEDLILHRASAEKIFNGLGWTLTPNDFMHLPTLLASLPMAMNQHIFSEFKKLDLTKTLWSTNVANMMPVVGEMRGGDSKKIVLGGRCGQILAFDPFKNKHGNFNATVCGGSGAGKSVFLQDYAMAQVATGGRVRIIDVGKSYKKICHILDGEFIDFKTNENLCLNPFTHTQDHEIEDFLDFTVSLMAGMPKSGTVSDIEQSFLEGAIQQVWDLKNNQGCIGDVIKIIKEDADSRSQDLAKKLRAFGYDGQYSKYFNSQATVNFKNLCIVFELEGISARLKQVVLSMLMYLITQEMMLGDRKIQISIIIDEAWDLLKGGYGANIIEIVARRARKYRGNLMTGSQGVKDYFASPAAHAAWENSYWQIFLKTDSGSVNMAVEEKKLDLNEYQRTLMNSLSTIHGEFSELMILGKEGEYAVGRMLLDNYAKTLYSTTGEEWNLVESLVKQGHPMDEAISILSKQLYGEAA